MLARYQVNQKTSTDLTECVNHLSMPNSVYIVHHLVLVQMFSLFADDDESISQNIGQSFLISNW